MSNVNPDNFFLLGKEPSENLIYLPPFRKGNLEPLIDGKEAFIAMEEAIVQAQKGVSMAMWIFNPYTPILSPNVRNKGIKTWADLLLSVVKRNVQVCILLSDFDPIFAEGLHRNNWNAYKKLVASASRLGAINEEQFQIISSLHQATVRAGVGDKLKTRLDGYVKALNKVSNKNALSKFSTWPGIWSYVKYDSKSKRFLLNSDVNLKAYPVSHHQKILIVDERTAFCGGLDVNTGRIDTSQHNSAKTSWHDIHCRVEGKAALDIYRNFVGRWNQEQTDFQEFVKKMNATKPPTPLPVRKMSKLTLNTPQIKESGKGFIQIHRTLSKDSWGIVPKSMLTDIKNGYEHAIKQANHFIYIENQYIRSKELGEWIIARAKQVPELQVIFVLPVAPEEVAAKGGIDEITNKGLAMQHEVLMNLQKELGNRFGMFSMVKKQQGQKRKTDSFNSPQVYVHSKCMIIDDVYANIGSANMNPRSFEMDTEIAAAWYDPVAVKAFRYKLWKELLGSPAGMEKWVPKSFVKAWTDVATAAEKATPNKRKAFVVRHNPKKFIGADNHWIPSEFAQYFDLEQGIEQEDDGILV